MPFNLLRGLALHPSQNSASAGLGYGQCRITGQRTPEVLAFCGAGRGVMYLRRRFLPLDNIIEYYACSHSPCKSLASAVDRLYLLDCLPDGFRHTPLRPRVLIADQLPLTASSCFGAFIHLDQMLYKGSKLATRLIWSSHFCPLS